MMGLLLKVQPKFRATLECLHKPPNENPLCTTCELIRARGWEAHWDRLRTNVDYNNFYLRKLRTELFFLRALPFMPWLDLLMSVMFVINVIVTYEWAAAIIAHEPGARAHAHTMFANAGAAVCLYFSQRYFRKTFF